MQTHYQILNVTPSASLEEINVAVKTQARKCHPDVGGSVDEIALVNLAASVLRDPVKRRAYDKELAVLYRACARCKAAGRYSVWKGQSVNVTCPDCGGAGYVG